MKKLVSLILLLALTLTALVACAPKDDGAKITVGVMSGPTGMGMAKLMCDTAEDSALYAFEVYESPDTATADLASGKLDMLCLPTNTAANLASKTDNYISVLAVNCLGSLYLLAKKDTPVTSFADLEGKTLTTSVATSTTKPIVDFLLAENHVNATVEVESDHNTLAARVKNATVEYAILPEPKVTAALMQNEDYEVKLNLSAEWDKVSDESLAMGCIVARNAFINEHKGAVNRFLDDYKASVEYIADTENAESSAQMIVNAGVLPKLPVAKRALANLNGSIVFREGKEMKETLTSFYSVLLAADPTFAGGALPKNSFYYAR